jgi:peptide/nickel transport system substrate-binding protein
MLQPCNAKSGERLQMSVRHSLFAAAIVSCVALALSPASGQTLRYANQGELKSLDPYTLKETTTIAHHAHIYEGLVTRDKNLKMVPALAESWETPEPTRWRFHLRHNVKFHNGDPFTADDVLFSADRIRAKGSNFLSNVAADAKFVKVDDYTVDVVLPAPNPILMSQWDGWYIMDKKWCEENNSVAPTPASATAPSYASLHENGTGPFTIESHQPGVKTVFKVNPNWWGKPEHNLKEIIFTPIGADATRVAALLSGDIDMMDPVPVQDIDRVKSSPNVTVMIGPEIRTIFLNMDSMREELLYASVKGKNPFKDARVRKAFYQAIDIEAIHNKVMRGMSVNSALMISPLLYSRAAEFKRHPYDVAAAKTLLADAGYAGGFEVTLDCPNDRYVNDEGICQAVAQMLSRIDIKVKLNAMPKAKYFQKAGPTDKYDSSFNLLGWTPGSLDSWNVVENIIGCRDANGKGGTFNFGGYCNPRITELNKLILVEADTKKRDELIAEAFRINHDEVGLIPLHQQSLIWGVSKKVEMVQRADNQILFYWVKMQ